MELLIVTGMSGAGKSQTAHVLEDIGYYCVDNIPPAIIPALIDLSGKSGEMQRVAIVTDIRGGEHFGGIINVLNNLKENNIEYKILFLDASDDVLVRRYKENRRNHPFCIDSAISLSEAVAKERLMLKELRFRADYLVDTSSISVPQLKQQLSNAFFGNINNGFRIQCMSFGFKYGPASEADLMLDVRCLPNPFYDSELRPLTGKEKQVQDYVLSTPEAKAYAEKLFSFIDSAVPLYCKEGKTRLTIAFGCTGGKHRSVTFAEKATERLKKQGYVCTALHRDITK